MRHLLPALALSLAGVCLPVSLDFAAPAADIALIKESPVDPVADPPPSPDRDPPLPADTADSADWAPSDPPQTVDAMSGRPSSPLSHEEICTLLASSAEDNALPVAFFVRLIWQESGFDRMSVSSAGAQGVAQFMPEVARERGVSDPFDPREALPASAHLLRDLHAKFGNLGLAAAAYNAGPRRVLDWMARRSGLPKETRDYVRIITGIPAEHWVNAKLQPGELQVPRRVPCAQVASVSEVPSPPQVQKSTGRTRHPAAPAVEYMRAASPSLPQAAGHTRVARHDSAPSRDRRATLVVKVADLKMHAKRGTEDRKGAAPVRVADRRMHAKAGGNDRKAAPVVRVAELKARAGR